MIELEKLFKAGVHFGHQKRRWCPKMEPYIWGYKNNVHLIDISKTAIQLEKASIFLKDIVSKGQTILWIGTKKAAHEIIEVAAKKLDMPFVNHRWIGGTLSNFAQVKKSVTKYLHYRDILEKADKYPHYTKKELNTIQKAAARLENNIGGIVHLTWPVGALVVVDVIKERSTLREAATMGVPVIGLVDTNADPSLVDYVIPTNDDSPRAIQVIIDYLSEAAGAGKAIAAAQKPEKKGKVAAVKEEVKVEIQEVVKFDELDEIEEEVSHQVKKAKVKVIAEAEAEGDGAVDEVVKKREIKKAIKPTISKVKK